MNEKKSKEKDILRDTTLRYLGLSMCFIVCVFILCNFLQNLLLLKMKMSC